MESDIGHPNLASHGSREEEAQEQKQKRTKSAKDSMVRKDASLVKATVSTNTPARVAGKQDMGNITASWKTTKAPLYGMIPKYLQYNIWDPSLEFTPGTADLTEAAKPLSQASFQ